MGITCVNSLFCTTNISIQHYFLALPDIVSDVHLAHVGLQRKVPVLSDKTDVFCQHCLAPAVFILLHEPALFLTKQAKLTRSRCALDAYLMVLPSIAIDVDVGLEFVAIWAATMPAEGPKSQQGQWP